MNLYRLKIKLHVKYLPLPLRKILEKRDFSCLKKKLGVDYRKAHGNLKHETEE